MQISCTSSSDVLSDRVRFPYYFQLLPSEVNLAHVFYSIIKEYDWRRVALIMQNEHRYRAVSTTFIEYMHSSPSLLKGCYLFTSHVQFLCFVDYECPERDVIEEQYIIF